MSPSPASSVSQLSDIVAELKAAYWMFRGMPEPKYYNEKTRERADRQWNRLAGELQRASVDPRRYIRWAYKELLPGYAVVWVNIITAPKVVARFHKEWPEAEKRERLLISLQFNTVIHETSMGRSMREILEDESLDLGDAVRYALARKSRMSDIADCWKRGAALDIDNEPVYRELLSDLLERGK